MVSNDHDEMAIARSRESILAMIDELHLRETELYRQRLNTLRNLEKHKNRVILQMNQLFHDSFQKYDHQCHRYGCDLRELRRELETLVKTKSDEKQAT